MSNKIADIADEIVQELENPNVGIVGVSYWLRNNLGKLNELLVEKFELTKDDFEIVDCNGDSINNGAKDIYKHMYYIRFYKKQIENNLYAAGVTSQIAQLTEGDSTIKLFNKNEIAKTFMALKKDAEASLKSLIHNYRSNRCRTTQIVGTDIMTGRGDCYDPYYRDYNRVN